MEKQYKFSIGFLKDMASDWDAFCLEVGLNPYCLCEGLADREDTISVSIVVLRKYKIVAV